MFIVQEPEQDEDDAVSILPVDSGIKKWKPENNEIGRRYYSNTKCIWCCYKA